MLFVFSRKYILFSSLISAKSLSSYLTNMFFALCSVFFVQNHNTAPEYPWISFFQKELKKKKTNIKPEYLTAESICLQVLFLSVAKSLLSVIIALEVQPSFHRYSKSWVQGFALQTGILYSQCWDTTNDAIMNPKDFPMTLDCIFA